MNIRKPKILHALEFNGIDFKYVDNYEGIYNGLLTDPQNSLYDGEICKKESDANESNLVLGAREIMLRQNNEKIPFGVYSHGTTNLIRNGSFENWSRGILDSASDAPDYWEVVMGSGHILRNSDAVIGSYSIKLTSGGVMATKLQQTPRIYGYDECQNYIKTKYYTLSFWIKSLVNVTTSFNAKLSLNGTSNPEAVLAGYGAFDWRFYTTTLYVPETLTSYSNLLVEIAAGDNTAEILIDGVSLVQGRYPVPFQINPKDYVGTEIHSLGAAWGDSQMGDASYASSPEIASYSHERIWKNRDANPRLYLGDGTDFKYLEINNS